MGTELRTALEPIMKAIAGAVGPHCEVTLHDLSHRDLDHTIVAIENGHVTGRQVGGPSTSHGLELLRDERADHDEFGYRGRTADGRELRSSSVYLRDADGRVVAALCINVDQSPLQAARAALDAVLAPPASADPTPEEIFGSSINEVLDQLVDTAVARTGRTPAQMDRDDRLAVLRFLEQRGAFVVKRAADRVARRLGVSRVTAYTYLEQVRAEPAPARGQGRPPR